MAVEHAIQVSSPGATEDVTGDLTTASFTPPANSLLIIGINFIDNGAHDSGITYTVTDSDSGTWTARGALQQTLGSFDMHHQCFSTPIDGTPVSMTVTMDVSNDAWQHGDGFVIDAITGHDTADPFVQTPISNSADKGGGDSESHTTAVLPSAVTSGNALVAFFCANNEVSGTFTVPSGFNAPHNLSGTEAHSAIFERDDTTATSVACTDLGQSIENVAATVFEIRVAAAVAAPIVRRRQLTTVRM